MTKIISAHHKSALEILRCALALIPADLAFDRLGPLITQ